MGDERIQRSHSGGAIATGQHANMRTDESDFFSQPRMY